MGRGRKLRLVYFSLTAVFLLLMGCICAHAIGVDPAQHSTRIRNNLRDLEVGLAQVLSDKTLMQELGWLDGASDTKTLNKRARQIRRNFYRGLPTSDFEKVNYIDAFLAGEVGAVHDAPTFSSIRQDGVLLLKHLVVMEFLNRNSRWESTRVERVSKWIAGLTLFLGGLILSHKTYGQGLTWGYMSVEDYHDSLYYHFMSDATPVKYYSLRLVFNAVVLVVPSLMSSWVGSRLLFFLFDRCVDFVKTMGFKFWKPAHSIESLYETFGRHILPAPLHFRRLSLALANCP